MSYVAHEMNYGLGYLPSNDTTDNFVNFNIETSTGKTCAIQFKNVPGQNNNEYQQLDFSEDCKQDFFDSLYDDASKELGPKITNLSNPGIITNQFAFDFIEMQIPAISKNPTKAQKEIIGGPCFVSRCNMKNRRTSVNGGFSDLPNDSGLPNTDVKCDIIPKFDISDYPQYVGYAEFMVIKAYVEGDENYPNIVDINTNSIELVNNKQSNVKVSLDGETYEFKDILTYSTYPGAIEIYFGADGVNDYDKLKDDFCHKIHGVGNYSGLVPNVDIEFLTEKFEGLSMETSDLLLSKNACRGTAGELGIDDKYVNIQKIYKCREAAFATKDTDGLHFKHKCEESQIPKPLGPDGIMPTPRPLGPDGIQKIKPLGPDGIQKIKPFGPDGIQKKNNEPIDEIIDPNTMILNEPIDEIIAPNTMILNEDTITYPSLAPATKKHLR